MPLPSFAGSCSTWNRLACRGLRMSLWGVLAGVVPLGAGATVFAQSAATTVVELPRISQDHQARAERMINRAIAYLRSQQDAKTGGWSVAPAGSGRPNLPAITGLVLNGMLLQPGIDHRDESVKRGVEFILSFRKPDGGIYDTILPSYNTAITLSALARVNTSEAKAAIKPGQDFLINSQWGTASPVGVGGQGGKEAPAVIDQANPNYGGLGYGNRGRPDISNLAFAVQAWHDTGLPKDDPAFKRAIVFLQRCQMLERLPDGSLLNDLNFAKGSRQGGFVYATGETEATPGIGHSFAGTIEETLSDGSTRSTLRAYGSVTYSGFKSYLYAGLNKNDPRVQAAVNWARNNYTLLENPGLGTDGYYYYIIMFSRAMAALEQNTIDIARFADLRTSVLVSGLPGDVQPLDVWLITAPAWAPTGMVPMASVAGVPGVGGVTWLVQFPDEEKARGALAKLGGATIRGSKLSASMQVDQSGQKLRRWREDLIDQLARLQTEDGSFTSVDDRWMENNPVLITAYALVALQYAAR